MELLVKATILTDTETIESTISVNVFKIGNWQDRAYSKAKKCIMPKSLKRQFKQPMVAIDVKEDKKIVVIPQRRVHKTKFQRV